MSNKVRLTQSALSDLYVINEYYLSQVSDRVAKRILYEIQVAVESLKELPERGAVPVELTMTGITRYRQILSSVYRIIYRIEDNDVFVVMVIDGRRDVASALTRRLLV